MMFGLIFGNIKKLNSQVVYAAGLKFPHLEEGGGGAGDPNLFLYITFFKPWYGFLNKPIYCLFLPPCLSFSLVHFNILN